MKWPLRNPFRRRRDHFEGILELFDDHVHIGEVTVGGRYVPRFSGPTLERFVGAKCDEQRVRRAVGLVRAPARPRDLHALLG